MTLALEIITFRLFGDRSLGKIIARWLLLFFVGLVLFFVARLFLNWSKSGLLTGKVGDFVNQTVNRVIETGGQILGQTIEQAPLDPKIKETIIKSGSVLSTNNNDQPLKSLSPEEIGNAVKEMPANQAKEIKKEIFGDFCQEIMKE